MPFSFLYLYFDIIADLGLDLGGPLRNTKACGFIAKECKIGCHYFIERDEDWFFPFLLKTLLIMFFNKIPYAIGWLNKSNTVKFYRIWKKALLFFLPLL